MAHHSTEAALLKLMNNLLLAVDSGDNAVLILLNLSATFDTVDHNILLSHLEQLVGFKVTSLLWFNSYLKSRTFSVVIGQFSSSVSISCGVPQGSVLGPLLFNRYMLQLSNIIRKYNISFHFYADDSQLYFPLKCRDSPLCILSWTALRIYNAGWQITSSSSTVVKVRWLSLVPPKLEAL